jgi:hypothetical protein
MVTVRRYRDDIRAGLIVLGTVVVLGIPCGFIWEAVSPKVAVVTRGQGVFYADPEGGAFIAVDGWFAVIGAAAGALCAVAAFIRYRRYGVGTVLGLAAGGVLASILAWQLGRLLGPASLQDNARTATEGVPFSGPLELRAYGVLLIWSLVSTTIFLAFTAGHDAEEPEPHQGEPEAERAVEGERGSDPPPADPAVPADRLRRPWSAPTPPGRWAPSEPE